ncbi:MAG: isoprenyl transferase [Clostridium sp.]
MIKLFKGSKGKDEDIKIDMDRIPEHIAIIMDGNGRWAKEKMLPRTMGHKAGVETIRRVIEESVNIGVKYLTLYAFSTENWKRPVDEVNALMKLLVEFLNKEIDSLDENNIRIQVLGNLTRLPLECQKEIRRATEKTKNNTTLTVNVALNYGGRDELVYAIQNICKEVRSGNLNIDSIDESVIENYLYTKGIPDPDIIIRPSGEQRISNFLLWQCAYSEFWYSNINWPDFKEEHLRKAISDFQGRSRRFGGLK